MKLRILLVSFLLIIFPLQALAADDYSNIKGDFKIFCLGDSKEITKAKVAYLKNKKEIRRTLHAFIYNTSIGKESVELHFYFKEDKLYNIFIASNYTFSIQDYHYRLKSYYLNTLLPILISAYGEPTKDLGYPFFFSADGTSYGSFWQLEKKVVDVGVKRNSRHIAPSGGPAYYAVINIYDKKYLEEDQKQQDIKINDAAKDF
jgi:hypothetical protein